MCHALPFRSSSSLLSSVSKSSVFIQQITKQYNNEFPPIQESCKIN